MLKHTKQSKVTAGIWLKTLMNFQFKMTPYWTDSKYLRRSNKKNICSTLFFVSKIKRYILYVTVENAFRKLEIQLKYLKSECTDPAYVFEITPSNVNLCKYLYIYNRKD